MAAPAFKILATEWYPSSEAFLPVLRTKRALEGGRRVDRITQNALGFLNFCVFCEFLWPCSFFPHSPTHLFSDSPIILRAPCHEQLATRLTLLLTLYPGASPTPRSCITHISYTVRVRIQLLGVTICGAIVTDISLTIIVRVFLILHALTVHGAGFKEAACPSAPLHRRSFPPRFLQSPGLQLF